MSKQWKWTLAAAALALALAAAPLAAATAGAEREAASPDAGQVVERSLVALTVDGDGAGGPTVRLRTDGPVDLESFVLENPDRLVVDLNGAISRLEGYSFPVERGGLQRVRAAQHRLTPVPVTRIVFDLDRPPSYRIDPTPDGVTVVFDGEPPLDASRLELAAAEPPAVTESPAEVETVATADPVAPVPAPSRAIDPATIEELLKAPDFAAPQAGEGGGGSVAGTSFESRKIVTDAVTYRGKRISLNLVDADIKQVFRLFHELSGLNFVLDPDVGGRVTIVLDNVPWDQALDIILKNNGLDKVLENNVLRIATTEKLAQEAAARKRRKEAEELEVEPVTLTRTLSYGKAKSLEQVLRGRGGAGGGGARGLLSERGTVIVDERTNTVIVSDIPKRVQAIEELLNVLDAETPQVMIEARIVETSKNFSQDLGIIWGFTAAADAAHGTSTGLSFPHNASAKYALNLPGSGGASNLAFSFGNIVDSFTLDIALNALETEGRGRIISAPKIATQNNERAEIEQGVRIPVTNTTATEIQVEFVSASLLLAVTPQITAEGTVVLDVVVENNSPDFVNQAGNIPSIRTQRAQTKVLISDGGTTVIGGIFTVNEGDTEIGVPWFRKIPIFGWLFRNRSVQQENRELLIFLTPKIVKLG